eukprot:2049315-Amphidinium_carterae.1
MCAYMSDKRTRVFRETERQYQGKVAELQSQLERSQHQFGQRVRETVDREVRHKSEQIAELQTQMRQGSDNFEVVQLREQLAVEKAKLEQLTWMEEQRARDVHEARDKILRGSAQHMEKVAVENLKSALAD